jgi:hypothetical protein
MTKLRQLLEDNQKDRMIPWIRKPITIRASANDIRRLMQAEKDPHMLTEWCRVWIELNKEL